MAVHMPTDLPQADPGLKVTPEALGQFDAHWPKQVQQKRLGYVLALKRQAVLVMSMC